MEKHTPGPLHCYDTSTGWKIRGGPHNHTTAEGMRKGDAILYAAAPDLLEACKNFFEWNADNFEDFDDETNMQLLCLANQAEAAIAKAEGK